MSILAIDQGTSGTKAIVVSDSGTLLGEAERPLHPRYLEGGRVEIDPAQLLDSVLESGRSAIRDSGVAPNLVSLANQGETVLAWDRSTGDALTPALVWQDRRAEGICERLASSARLFEATCGLRLDPYFSAPKMAWIRENLTRSGVVTTSDSWLLHRLCGEFVTDVSTASRSMLVGLSSANWDDRCLTAFGLEDEPLPEIVGCDQIIGRTEAFGHPMEVGGLIVDQAAALLAQGCSDAGQAKCTFGTGAFLLANCGPEAAASTAGLTTSIAWKLGTELRYYMDGQVYAAGSALRWLQQIGILSSPRDVDSQASPEAGAVVCVPSLAGLAAPWWRPTATARFEGLGLSTSAGQIIAAVLEGIAAQLAVVADAIDSDLDRPISAIKADGGLTRSKRLMQAVADVTQRPVVLGRQANVTALGAAAVGRAALGVEWDDLTAWESEQVFEPSWSADRAHRFRSEWEKACSGHPE